MPSTLAFLAVLFFLLRAPLCKIAGASEAHPPTSWKGAGLGFLTFPFPTTFFRLLFGAHLLKGRCVDAEHLHLPYFTVSRIRFQAIVWLTHLLEGRRVDAKDLDLPALEPAARLLGRERAVVGRVGQLGGVNKFQALDVLLRYMRRGLGRGGGGLVKGFPSEYTSAGRRPQTPGP